MSIKLLAFCRRDVNFLRKPAIFFLIIIITINLYLTINKKYDKHAYTFIKHYHTETDLNAAYAVIENDTNYSNVTKDGLMIKGEIQKEGNFEDMMRDELKAYMESTTEKYDTYTWSCY